MNGSAVLPDGRRRISSVEFWRFLFTVLVSLYHLELFYTKRKIFTSGSSAVEFFFVLSGFLIALSSERSLSKRTEPVTVRQAHLMALDFVKKKLKIIYPVLIFALLIWVFTAQPAEGGRLAMAQRTEWELLMLVGTPFGFDNGYAPNIPLWFLTALIITGYIYTYAINRHHDFVMFAAPVVGILLYVYYALCADSTLDHTIEMGVLNAGMVKALAEVSLGISVFGLYKYLKQKKFGVFWKIIISLLELYAIYRFFRLTLYQPLGLDNYRRTVYILIIVLTSFLNVTPLTKLLNHGFSRLLGKISLAMYITHYNLIYVYFTLLGKVKLYLMRHMLSSGFCRSLWSFFKDTGGYDASFRAIPMGIKDMALFMFLVIAVAILINLIIAAIKKFIVRPCMKKHTVQKAGVFALTAAGGETDGCENQSPQEPGDASEAEKGKNSQPEVCPSGANK